MRRETITGITLGLYLVRGSEWQLDAARRAYELADDEGTIQSGGLIRILPARPELHGTTTLLSAWDAIGVEWEEA